MKRLAALLLLLVAQAQAQSPPASGTMSPPDTWLPKPGGELILLDKLRGQPTTITLKNGQATTFGTLGITLVSCVARPPDLPQNAAAFLEVVDSKGTTPVFRGWVVSNMPSLRQLEHPVYDLRLVACR